MVGECGDVLWFTDLFLPLESLMLLVREDHYEYHLSQAVR
jgi:hypothetical protein